MRERPILSNGLSGSVFSEYYYLKEELIAFCRENGLQTTGGKMDISKRIAHYLDTGEKTFVKLKSRNTPAIGEITADSRIEGDFVCSEKHRAFFEQAIGKGFKFNVLFQKWLKANSGKTYQEAIEAYSKILSEKKNNKATIDKQFEYNTYMRDFFAYNSGRTLDDAIKCWKYKKSMQGHNRYEKTDLIALT